MNNHKGIDIGKVYLVGAGPGDPKLITIRAIEVLAIADVVVNDRLASAKLLDEFAPADAEIIYAGKASRNHTLSQDDIIETIIDKAKQGKTVVRLKGGDPFVFGRGGEEAEALYKAGIPFEVVPGISSSVAVPAYAGIPVTSRSFSTSFAVITGHEAPGKESSSIRWDKLAIGPDTLVFLMGVENLPNIVNELIKNGRSADTPAAVIMWGTLPKQRTAVGTLENIVEKCRNAGIKAPAVTVVGDVVRLRDSVSWFENRPLFGRKVIVTRAESQASILASELEELGAEVDEYPVIKFVAPPSYEDIDCATDRIGEFDWIIFTSANGVEWFVKRLYERDLDIRAMAGPKIAAIGPKTASALKLLKLKVDYIPSEYVAEAVVNEFPDEIEGKSILIPRAVEAREELPEGLRNKGAAVTVVPAYQTVLDDFNADNMRKKITDNDVDIITFTSASTVNNFMSIISGLELSREVIIACIGPITADAVRKYGLEPTIIAKEYTIEGLAKELVSILGNKKAE